MQKRQKKSKVISGVSSIEITEAAGTVSSAHYNVLKLNEDEFWYSFTNGGATHEFRLVK